MDYDQVTLQTSILRQNKSNYNQYYYDIVEETSKTFILRQQLHYSCIRRLIRSRTTKKGQPSALKFPRTQGPRRGMRGPKRSPNI